MTQALVLYTRDGGDELIYTHTDESGAVYGLVKMADGTKFEPMLVGSIVARGYWKWVANAPTQKTTKAIKPEVAIEPSVGVPSSLEVARALSRLEILPNPDDPTIPNLDKFVESPWQTLPTPSVDPNVWDEAEIALLPLADLFGTDPFLRRKTVRKHIDAMGQALRPRRSYAMILNIGGKNLIIDGHHRLMALWLLGLDKAPVWLVKE